MKNKSVIRQFLKFMAEVFDLLSNVEIVHADIKPENILIEFDN